MHNMIITIKGLKDIQTKITENNRNREKEVEANSYSFQKRLSDNEIELFRKVEYMLLSKIRAYESIQKLTEELVKASLKFKESEMIEAYISLYMHDYD